MKLFYVDVETSGLDPLTNDILTLSGLIEIDGEVKEAINLKMKPFNWNNISEEALKINGLTIEQIKTFDEPIIAKQKLESLFCKYVDKYKKNKTSEDKLMVAGYNVNFDFLFIEHFWKKCGDKYLGSFLDYHKMDLSAIVLFLKYKGLLQFHGYKLVQVAEALGCSFKTSSHDAESDILVTREIGNKIIDLIQVKK